MLYQYSCLAIHASALAFAPVSEAVFAYAAAWETGIWDAR